MQINYTRCLINFRVDHDRDTDEGDVQEENDHATSNSAEGDVQEQDDHATSNSDEGEQQEPEDRGSSAT